MNIFGGNKARDLTAEIDRETDADVLAENLAEKARAEAAKTEIHELEQGPGWQAGEVSAETRALGGVALEQAVIKSNEAIKEQVAIENGYVDTGLEAGRNVIGGESEKQIIGRSEDDLKHAQMESGVDLPPELQGEAKILADNQEDLAKGAVAAMDRLMRQRDVKPYQMERQAWLMRAKMMKTMGRGERN